MKENRFKTLYLCYFGLREPLVQTQVLPYLREIKKGGTAVSILTFETNPKENWTAQQIQTEKKKLAAARGAHHQKPGLHDHRGECGRSRGRHAIRCRAK